jgi:hypothetical protein
VVSYSPSRAAQPALLAVLFTWLVGFGAAAWRTALRTGLTLLGLASITTGAFLFSLVLGFVVLGVALLVFEFLVKQ